MVTFFKFIILYTFASTGTCIRGKIVLNELALVALSNCNWKVNAIPCSSKRVYRGPDFGE